MGTRKVEDNWFML